MDISLIYFSLSAISKNNDSGREAGYIGTTAKFKPAFYESDLPLGLDDVVMPPLGVGADW
jgi:hypothetical protein